MLRIEDTIQINKYGQELLDIKDLLEVFLNIEQIDKKKYLEELISLIIQSKPKEDDIELAIKESGLKATYTPCVLITQGVKSHNLQRLVELPENEQEKTFILLLNLFKISYQRRFNLERGDTHKWWYWDLSDDKNIEKIMGKI